MTTEERNNLVETMRRLKICVLVPTYNNEKTVGKVVSEILGYADDVIVVNDGSTDTTPEILKEYEGRIQIISYKDNKGKGHALKKGFQKALESGYEYAITIDSDGQHYPDDIPNFVKAIAENYGALIIGERNLSEVDINGKSSFANKFSNFWFSVHTGHNLKDTQTGYRAYPLKKISGLSILTRRYEAELELLVFTSWKDVTLKSIPIKVYYPPQAERISHFKPAKDFTRISILNTILCILALVYGYPSYFFCKIKNKNIFKKEFTLFTKKKGERREANLTIDRLFRSIYSVSHFIFWSSLVFKPYVFFNFKLSKGNEKKRLKLHKKIQSISSFFAHNFPGGKTKIENPFNETFEKPALLICNHQSHLDLPIILSIYPKLIFITNDWVWNNRFFGDIIKAAKFFPATMGYENLKNELKSLVNTGYSVVVFPEGTRSEDGKIRRFHQGAFALANELGLDIIPMALHGASDYLPKNDFMLRKNPQQLLILGREEKEKMTGLPLFKKASYYKKLIEDNLNKMHVKEDIDYHRHNVLYRYAYRGWRNVSRSKREMRILLKHKDLIEGLDRETYFFNPGIGIWPLMAALVNKDKKIIAVFENQEDFQFFLSLKKLPKNLEVRQAIWENDFKDVEPGGKVIVLESKPLMKILKEYNPTLIKM